MRRRSSGAARTRRARIVRVALATFSALALIGVALLLSGCATTAEKSAKLERAAKRVNLAAQQGLSITHESKLVKVLSATLVHGSEGTAAVLRLHNSSPRALREVPIAISLKDAHGAPVYSNATPGLAKTLTSIALLPAHSDGLWIDDQIPGASGASITTKVGEGTVASASEASAASAIKLSETHPASDSGGAATVQGTISNGSSAGQSELVIYAVAQRSGRVLAAGRAVLASLAAGASAPFQIFFIGSPKGAQLQLSAPPTGEG